MGDIRFVIDKIRKEIKRISKELGCEGWSPEEFVKWVNWSIVCTNHSFKPPPFLPEFFIREFQDKVDWHWVCEYQKLSENFIREFQDKVDWSQIFRYQKLSLSFIFEFKDRGGIEYLIRQKVITTEELKRLEYRERINDRMEILDL